MSTILYAEDDRDCRELFAFVLRQQEHTVYEANNGAQAVQIVRDEPVDLVIMDVRMPMMTGFDAAKIIAGEAPHVPVIFLSAKGLAREINKGFDCGNMVVDYLVKPVSTEQLVNRVEQVLYGCRKRGLKAVREESLAQLVEVGPNI
ncbi:MAG: response regulator transcription factor [Anaerolineae bacterium]